jgi:hypothetical protein
MLEGEGRIIVQGEADRPTKLFVYVPVEIARDSQFPFHGSGPVSIRVDLKAQSLVVEESNKR